MDAWLLAFVHLSLICGKVELRGTEVGDGVLQALSATQTPVSGSNWFQGTADAVRQFAWLIEVRIKTRFLAQ